MSDATWADGWAKLIQATGAAAKDVILALGVLWGAYSVAGQGTKLDVAAEKATAAATEAAEAKKTLHASIQERREQFSELGAKIDASPMAAAAAAAPAP